VYKLTGIDAKDREVLDKYYHGNEVKDVGMVEISLQEFYDLSCHIYSPTLIGYVQALSGKYVNLQGKHKQFGVPTMQALHLNIFHDGGGYAVEHCFGPTKKGIVFVEYARYWRYYKFDGPCRHVYRAPTQEDFARGVPRPAMCYHVSVCARCGRVDTVDSSD